MVRVDFAELKPGWTFKPAARELLRWRSAPSFVFRNGGDVPAPARRCYQSHCHLLCIHGHTPRSSMASQSVVKVSRFFCAERHDVLTLTLRASRTSWAHADTHWLVIVSDLLSL